METNKATVKLVNHNVEGEFYLQINGDVEQLIAEGKENGFWLFLYNYIKDCPYLWELGASERAAFLPYTIRVALSKEFILWSAKVLKRCWILQKEELAFEHGIVKEIVT